MQNYTSPAFGKKKRARTHRTKSVKAQISALLVLENLKPKEVVERGLVKMFVADLYRLTKNGRFYCAMPRSEHFGRVYPAWQFVEPLGDMLLQVLRTLKEQGKLTSTRGW